MTENVNFRAYAKEPYIDSVQNGSGNKAAQPVNTSNQNFAGMASNYPNSNLQGMTAEDIQKAMILEKLRAMDMANGVQKPQDGESAGGDNLSKLVDLMSSIVDYQKGNLNFQNDKLEYLEKILSKYDSDKYLKNPEFQKLYGAAFEALGTDLDTDMFVDLIDKYVESRLAAEILSQAAVNENDRATDGIQFQSGKSKKSQRKLRMQDIPAEELESYIAKYI